MPRVSMRVRRARPAEAPGLADLWLRSRAAAAPAIPPTVHPENEVRAWFAGVVLPNREVWVADDDGTVVGLMVLDHDWIDQLYVDVGRTGQGVGRRLLAVARRERPSGLRLWTFEANAGARRFYERHGFVATGSTDGENEEGAPDVLYEWHPPPG